MAVLGGSIRNRSVNFRVLGVRELVLRFEVGTALAAQAQAAAVAAAAEEVERLAKVYAPRDTGDLADSIAASKIESKVIADKYRVTYGKAMYYGRFQELGTSRMPAHPFLRPASDTATLSSADAAARRILERA
jgi:HK97 gp10 family phage protein